MKFVNDMSQAQVCAITGLNLKHVRNLLASSDLRFRPDLKIAVEVDGCYWHSCPKCGLSGPEVNKGLDKRKNTYLRNRGWLVLRFWGHDIKKRPDWCVTQIQSAVENRNGLK